MACNLPMYWNSHGYMGWSVRSATRRMLSWRRQVSHGPTTKLWFQSIRCCSTRGEHIQLTDAPMDDAWAHGAILGLKETLQRFLDTFLAPGTGQGTLKAVEVSAYCFHGRVLGAVINGGAGCTAMLLEFLRSDLAAAAAAQLAVPTCSLLSSFSQSTTEHGELKSLEAALRQVAAGSLVAMALLRCLHLDGACRQLGTSHAYRLASSVQVALGLGRTSALLIVNHAAAFSSTAPMPRADLPACPAHVVVTHLLAVDCCCQLLRQQAGTQLQQALQRTCATPTRWSCFGTPPWRHWMRWRRLPQVTSPGCVSKSHQLWYVLASILSQLYIADVSSPPLLKGWDANPHNLKYWNCLQRLVDARLVHLLSTPERSHSEAWADQWCSLTEALCGAAQHLMWPSTPGTLQMLATMTNTVPWPLGGQRSTMALLTAGTLRLLQSRHGRPLTNAGREQLGTCGAALLTMAKLGLEQGHATPRQVQTCMEAVTLGLAAVHPMVDAKAEGKEAASEATVWLAKTVDPALELLTSSQDVELWQPDTSDGSQEEELGLPAAAAAAAEAALRVAAACVQLWAAQPPAALEARQMFAAKVCQRCMCLAEQLASACKAGWEGQARHPGRSQLHEPLRDAAFRLGVSAAKLALTVFRLVASALPDSFVWEFGVGIITHMQAVITSSFDASTAALGAAQGPDTPLHCMVASMQAALEAVLPVPSTVPEKAKVCLWLAAIGCISLWGAHSPVIFGAMARTTLTAAKQALDCRLQDMPVNGVVGLVGLLHQAMGHMLGEHGYRLAVLLADHGFLQRLVAHVKSACRSTRGLEQMLDLPESLQKCLLAVTGHLLANPGTSDPAPLATVHTQLQHATKAQLGAKRFWERCVEQGLLPALLSAAAAAEAARQAHSGSQESLEQQQQQEREQELGVARVLALRPCANPLCTNVRGCSERRLRGMRCGGCCVVRYCSEECQLQHWTRHGQVCAALAAQEPQV